MVRREVVPPAHQGSNPRFDTGVSHLGGIFFSGRRRSRRQRGARGDFVNVKIRPPDQSFGGAHRGRVCVCAFIGMSAYTCMWVSALYCVSQKKGQMANSMFTQTHLWFIPNCYGCRFPFLLLKSTTYEIPSLIWFLCIRVNKMWDQTTHPSLSTTPLSPQEMFSNEIANLKYETVHLLWSIWSKVWTEPHMSSEHANF